MTGYIKYILIGMLVFLLNACATTYETKTGSVRSQNLMLDATHDGKDLVLTFPAWTSEADKRESLNSSAIAKASQKCPGVAYKLINVYSTPYVFSMNISTTKINGISANIQCDVGVKDIVASSFSKDKNNVNNLPECQGSDITKWSHCFAPYSTPSGTFVGEWMNGKFHGQGTLTLPIGWKYEGEFRNGVRYGQGTHIDKDGNKYVGAFRDGKEHGNGVLSFAKGNKYEGDFRDGKRSGQGTFTFANGNKYVGDFKNDQYSGQGIFYASNGSILQQGIWAENKFIRSEPIQEANISNNASRDKNNFTNLPACQGSDILKWTNCFGTRVWVNGQKYIGEFKDGNYHGQGTFYAVNGSVIHQGIWTNGSFGSGPAQLATTPNIDREKDRADAEESKRKQAEQEQLRLSQNQPPVLSPSPPVTASFMGKRLALVIGNASYKVRPLLNPRNDADDVSRVLRSTGFEVIDLRDATLGQMRASVRQFGERLMSNDVGLVYYSGHGIEVKGRNYFIPVNADIKASDEVADQALDVSLILAKMDTAKKGVNILIVDACRDDPFGRSFRSNSRGLATMDAPQGTLIAYATAPGSVAADGTGRNSPFTKHLVRAMQVPNTPIELMFKEVRRAVREETKNQQTPWENSSLIGNFYFSVKK